jgi:hypothetical protein
VKRMRFSIPIGSDSQVCEPVLRTRLSGEPFSSNGPTRFFAEGIGCRR